MKTDLLEKTARHSESRTPSMRDLQAYDGIREQNTEMQSIPGRDSKRNSIVEGRPQETASRAQWNSI